MLKPILAQIKDCKRDSILTPLFMLGEVAMEMLIPLMMASIIDQGVTAGDLGHIKTVGFWMLLAALGGLIAGILGAKSGARASAGLARNLRQAMFTAIQTFSFSNIDKFSTASLITRLTTDVSNVQNAYMMLLRMCTRAPASMIVAMILAFVLSPRLASIYLIAVILLGLALFFLLTRAMASFKQVFRKYDDLNASVQENVSGIRVVKAYVREKHETSKFQNACRNIYTLFLRAEKTLSWNFPVMNFTIYACILLVSWLGAHMIVGGTLSTGALMSLLTYCLNILMSLMMLSMIFVMLSMSVASAERIAEVLEEQPDLSDPCDPCTEISDGSVEFRHVDFSYKKDASRPVLKDVSFSVRSGETIGILGSTGSAKTSLVNLISRLYDVTAGQVLVGGRDVRDYDTEALRDQVSVVLQKNVLFSGSILENLRWGDASASRDACIRACELACADAFIQAMPEGYDTILEQGGSNLSGGQKQRLCIARALLKHPKILILDDATSAVDTATDAKIRRSFAQEIPDTTKFIISQRIASLDHADRILILDDGQVQGFDTPKALLEHNKIYQDVYRAQTSGGGDFDEGGVL